MSDTGADGTDTPRDPPGFLSNAAFVVAMGWLTIPALQYLGAFDRTRVLLGEEPWSPVLVLLDVAPAYVALLVGTICLVVARAVAARAGRRSS